jgi:hypothetical protein
MKLLVGLWSKFFLLNHRGLKLSRKNSLLQSSSHLVYLLSAAKGVIKYKHIKSLSLPGLFDKYNCFEDINSTYPALR